MGFHTFAAGEVLTAANVNNFLMNQAVIVCTSGTRPSSPVAGMYIWESDTLNLMRYTGAAWIVAVGSEQSWSPTWTKAGTTLTTGTGTGYWKRIGDNVTVYAEYAFTSSDTMTGGAWVTLTGAVPAISTTAGARVGLGTWCKLATSRSAIAGTGVAWISDGANVIHLEGSSGFTVGIGDVLAVELNYLAGTTN